MIQIYQLINNNQSKFYLYLKAAGSAVILLFFLTFINHPDEISYKLTLISMVVSIFTTLFWGIIFTNQKFNKNVAKSLILIDSAVIYFLIYPVAYFNYAFIILPFLLLISIVFLFSKKDFIIALISFFLMFTAACFLFGILNVIEESILNYAVHIVLYGLIFGVSKISINAVRELEEKQEDLNAEKKLIQSKYANLERELLLKKQHVKILDKDVRKKDVEIKNILALSDQLNIRDDSRKALTSFLLTAIGQIGSSYAFILKKQKKENNFINVFIQKGLRGYDLSKVRIYLHSNLIQILSAMREPILVSQIPRDVLYDDEIKLINNFQKDLISPVFVKGSLTGLFFIGHKVSGSAFKKEDIDLISIITNQLSFVLEQTQMTSDYHDFYAKTLRAMLQALEAKYIYSRGHNIRTANYVNIIAQKMGVQGKEIKDMVFGTLLHDIGKIAIKDEYLLNKEKFKDDSIVKKQILQHTIEGSKILEAAGFNKSIVDMALHHHEFYNGKGYPHQLEKNNLSISSRILAVCNAYDAMTSDRPHRKALPDTTAKEYLRYYSGTQFDPDIAKIFLNELVNNQKMLKYQ